MARYRGPRARKSRRLDFPVFESPKFSNLRKNYIPGQHGPNQRIKHSNYRIQLREKQRIKYLYGVTNHSNRIRRIFFRNNISIINFMIVMISTRRNRRREKTTSWKNKSVRYSREEDRGELMNREPNVTQRVQNVTKVILMNQGVQKSFRRVRKLDRADMRKC